jgi:peptide/nickel transport system ATP-binding protein
LFITHDLSLGNYISDRTVILRRGAVVEMGQTALVFGNPQHPYTRMLMSAVPQLHRKWHAADGDLQPGTGWARTNDSAGRPQGVAYPDRFSRAGARRISRMDLDRALTPPVLVECEPGHLVASDDEPLVVA